jgi:hypothetical protein
MTGGKFKLSKQNRASIEAAAEEASLFGATVGYDLIGRHPKITVYYAGQSRSSPFSSTPRSGEFAATFVRQRVRQIVREIDRDRGSSPDRAETGTGSGSEASRAPVPKAIAQTTGDQ